jgi:hypothetical protein
MSQTSISAGQSLVDVTVQEYGSVEALFDLADAAGVAITDQLTPGQVLEVPASAAAVPAVAGYFSNRQQRINVGDEPQPVLERRQLYFSDLFFNIEFYA